jgi:hypothetical protein
MQTLGKERVTSGLPSSEKIRVAIIASNVNKVEVVSNAYFTIAFLHHNQTT